MATLMRALGKGRFLMAAAKTADPTAASKPLSGIMKPVPISPLLKDFLGGADEASRSQAVKKVWEHIKLHNLQNPANKKEIICDQKLKTLFSGKDKVGFMEIARFLSPHFIKTK